MGRVGHWGLPTLGATPAPLPRPVAGASASGPIWGGDAIGGPVRAGDRTGGPILMVASRPDPVELPPRASLGPSL